MGKARVQDQYISILNERGHTGQLTGAANTAQDIRDRIQTFEDIFRRAAA